MVGAAELAAMKPDALIVNVARGGVIDEAALAAALEAGTIGGAAVDVFSQEPPAPESPLLRAPNTILTPHRGRPPRRRRRASQSRSWSRSSTCLRDGPPGTR
jgi:phosphoglycerate dehydrogenase-like enzyme